MAATLACHHKFFPENVLRARSTLCNPKSGMKNNNAGKFIILVVSFAIVSLLLNNIKFLQPHHALLISPTVATVAPTSEQVAPISQQQQQQEQEQQKQEAAAEKAAADAAAEHAKFLARYLNSGFSRTPGSEMLAVVVATGDGKLDKNIGSALANHFKTNSVKVFTSFFKPEFVSDNFFANVFDGSTDVLNKLELANSLDVLVLAQETVDYSKTPSLDNITTANLQLEVQVVPIAGNVQNQTKKFIANGAGFSQTEAESNAEDRLLKQIANDTNLSLVISPN
jgi:hypothetical protein